MLSLNDVHLQLASTFNCNLIVTNARNEFLSFILEIAYFNFTFYYRLNTSLNKVQQTKMNSSVRIQAGNISNT